MPENEFYEHFAAEWIETWNSHDIERIMSHYDESLKFSSPKLEKLIPGSGGKLEGKEAVRSYWVKALSAQPELHFELIAVLKGIQSVVIHYRGVGGNLCAEFFMGGLNSMEPNIRRLGEADASALVALRREALETEPLAFGASPADDVGLLIESVRRFLGNHDTQAVFAQFEGPHLAGMIALVKAAKVKERHKATVWGMYVQPHARNRGVGRALVRAAIEQARRWDLEQLQLSVTEAAPAAKRLYEAEGFEQWGRAPRSLHWNGRFVDEYHLVLELRESPTPAVQS